MLNLLQPEELDAIFNGFKQSAFRLEGFDEYVVPEETVEFQRFLNGEPLSASKNQDWCGFVSASVGHGKTITRLRVMTVPLTPYLRFEIDWGYVYSATAGEAIYLLPRHDAMSLGLDNTNDFWLFDDETVIKMEYDSVGHFIGGMSEDAVNERSRLISLRDTLLARSLPLKEYLKQLRTR